MNSIIIFSLRSQRRNEKSDDFVRKKPSGKKKIRHSTVRVRLEVSSAPKRDVAGFQNVGNQAETKYKFDGNLMNFTLTFATAFIFMFIPSIFPAFPAWFPNHRQAAGADFVARFICELLLGTRFHWASAGVKISRVR